MWMWKINSKSVVTGYKDCGKPVFVSKDEAEAAAKKLNFQCPSMHHWVIGVDVPSLYDTIQSQCPVCGYVGHMKTEGHATCLGPGCGFSWHEPEEDAIPEDATTASFGEKLDASGSMVHFGECSSHVLNDAIKDFTKFNAHFGIDEQHNFCDEQGTIPHEFLGQVHHKFLFDNNGNLVGGDPDELKAVVEGIKHKKYKFVNDPDDTKSSFVDTAFADAVKAAGIDGYLFYAGYYLLQMEKSFNATGPWWSCQQSKWSGNLMNATQFTEEFVAEHPVPQNIVGMWVKVSKVMDNKEHNPVNDDLQVFFNEYKGTALWASTDEGGKDLDSDYGIDDFDDETEAEMLEDCIKFLEANRELIEKCDSSQYTGAEMAGQDFWLSRNCHGSGFFERQEWDEETRDKLQAAAEAFGEVSLYVENGKVFQQ